MFLLRKPTADDIHHYIRDQRSEPFSYEDVGLSKDDEHPRGFDVARHSVELGAGKQVFDSACEAIRNWEMFPREMASLYWPSVEPVVGSEVVVGFRVGPLWSLNPCRVIYTVDSGSDSVAKFGFAYGTLPGHVERGEERFQIVWDRTTDIVSYEIFVFSAGQHVLAKIGYPFVLLQQSRFRKLSGRAMQRFVIERSARVEPTSQRVNDRNLKHAYQPANASS